MKNLDVLAEQVRCPVGETTGVRDHRLRQIHDRCRHSWIPGRQALLAIFSGGRALEYCRDTFVLSRVGLLKVDRVQSHHHIGRIFGPDTLARPFIQPLAQAGRLKTLVAQEAIDPFGCMPNLAFVSGHLLRYLGHHRALTADDAPHTQRHYFF